MTEHKHIWYLYRVKEYEEENAMFILRRCVCGAAEEACIKIPKFGKVGLVQLRK